VRPLLSVMNPSFRMEEEVVVSGLTSTILAALDVCVTFEQRDMSELIAITQRRVLSTAFWLPSGW
jgi:hypothetical protein